MPGAASLSMFRAARGLRVPLALFLSSQVLLQIPVSTHGPRGRVRQMRGSEQTEILLATQNIFWMPIKKFWMPIC